VARALETPAGSESTAWAERETSWHLGDPRSSWSATALVRLPSVKSRRKFLAKSKDRLRKHRHGAREDQQRQLALMLRGFYQYFG